MFSRSVKFKKCDMQFGKHLSDCFAASGLRIICLNFFKATLCEAFPGDSDYESTIWRSLVFTGLGLTAVATILALQK